MRDRPESYDNEVRERFVRVVGLPPDEDDAAWRTTAAQGGTLGQGGDPAGADEPISGSGSGSAPTGVRAPAATTVPDLDAPPRGPGRSLLDALNPGQSGVRAMAALAVLVLVVAGFVAWRSRPRIEPVPAAAVPAPSAAAHTSPAYLIVAVSGRVQRPGLVRLPAGARVADAIEAAGGVLAGTDLTAVNLARKLVDGELIVIGVTPPPAVGAAPGTGPDAGPVNLNTATAAELEALPGVGPVLAQHIVDYRTRHGGFRSVSELRQVDGVGDSRFAQLKDLVTV